MRKFAIVLGAIAVLALAQSVIRAEDCSAGDPVFIQADARDVQALHDARMLFKLIQRALGGGYVPAMSGATVAPPADHAAKTR